jgi:hypothetical protein
MKRKLARAVFCLAGTCLVSCASQVVENDEFPFLDPMLATLSSASLTKPTDAAFAKAREELSFRVLPKRPPFVYQFWRQKQPAPLVVLLPGHGATADGRHPAYLGEALFRRGYNVASLPSTTHRDFIIPASKLGLPGYPADDIADLRRVLDLLLKDLEIRHPAHIKEKALVGVSLGGLHALWLSQGNSDGFALYLGINPPLEMAHAQKSLDEAYDVPLSWSDSRRNQRTQLLLRRVDAIKQGLKVGPEVVDAFGEEDRHFVIGYEFRFSLAEMIIGARRLHPELARGLSPEEVMSRYSYRSYTETVTLPSLRARGLPATWEEWNTSASLLPRIKDVGANPRALLFHSLDDLLIAPEMALAAKKAFGDRAWIYRYGSHTGVLSTPRFMRQFLAEVEKYLGAP